MSLSENTHSTQARVKHTRKRETSSASSGMEILSLMAEPEAELTEEYSVPQGIRLKVRKGNRVWGMMNGKRCSLHLDSGTSKTFMFFSLAKKLGLVIGGETDTETYHLWMGTRQVEFITLKNVLITLEGGVNVLTPVRVLSEVLEMYYDPDEVVLDVHLLSRGSMVQTFSNRGSNLYIREPSRLLRNTKMKEQVDQVPSFLVRWANAEDASPMFVVLDTGAENFYVSKYALSVLTDEANETKVPERVSLDLGGGYCLETDKVEFIAQEVVDLVMGVHLLHKYNAVVDYGGHSITFTVRDKHFKFKLYLQ